MASMNPPAKHLSNGKPRWLLLLIFEQRSWTRSGRPETARPSNDSLKFSKVASIVEACSDLIAREVGKFSTDVVDALASRQTPEHKANRDTCALQTWFATQGPGIAYDVVLP